MDFTTNSSEMWYMSTKLPFPIEIIQFFILFMKHQTRGIRFTQNFTTKAPPYSH